MSTALAPDLRSPRAAAGIERPQRGAPVLFDDGVTLEDRVLRVWEDLVAEGSAACLVCGGSMSAGDGCRGCGSRLT